MEKKLGTFLMRICEKINGKNMKFWIQIFEIFFGENRIFVKHVFEKKKCKYHN
jgi:hypothetical protein